LLIELKIHKTIRLLKKNSGMVKDSKKSKIKTPTPEFLILSERLKEAARLQVSGKYRDRDFDKLIDAL
jgi:hypothetical protein